MKAQVWSADFAVSLVVFFFAIVLVILAWTYISAQHQEEVELNRIENIALRVSDVLVRTPGYPDDWETMCADWSASLSCDATDKLKNIKSIGLASSENTLSKDKVAAFEYLLMNRNAEMKQILGIGNYDMDFRIYDLNNRCMFSCLVPLDSYIAVPVERYALLDYMFDETKKINGDIRNCGLYDSDRFNDGCYSPYNKIVKVRLVMYLRKQ